MTDSSKIKLTHTQRAAYVYIRQSTPGQVEHNRESTARQYALAIGPLNCGWPKEQVVIIDEDLGLSGSTTDKRSGFTRLTSESGARPRGHRSWSEGLRRRGTTPIGIACSNYAASLILSLATTTASIIPRFLTIA